MAPTQKGRVVLLALTIFIVYFLFFSGSSSSQLEADFRRRTEQGIAKRRGSVMQGGLSDEELLHRTNEKLQDIIDNHPHYGGSGASDRDEKKLQAEPKDFDASLKEANERIKSEQESLRDGESSRSSKKKTEDGEEERDTSMRDAEDQIAEQKGSGRNIGKAKTGAGQRKEDKPKKENKAPTSKDVAREKLEEYFKKPVVIFSKSYCPHSKQAKRLLLELYTIVPAPLVVELDELTDTLPADPDDETDYFSDGPRPLGLAIQSVLGDITGRRTVPNIMIGTQSIGGNDLIWDLHEKGQLAATIARFGGSRVTKVEAKEGVKVKSLDD